MISTIFVASSGVARFCAREFCQVTYPHLSQSRKEHRHIVPSLRIAHFMLGRSLKSNILARPNTANSTQLAY